MRVTERCYSEDLACRSPYNLEKTNHIIIKAFLKERRDAPIGAEMVSPLTCGKEVWALRRTHYHRGATWHDTANGVLWLCAYCLHCSGDPDDAYPYFKDLDRAGRLLPCRADLALLEREQRTRFFDLVTGDAENLLQRAHANPNKEQAAVIGGGVPTGIVVEVVETLEELAVAMKIDLSIQMDMAVAILNALEPGSVFGDWWMSGSLPTRELCMGEICWRYSKD
jgi:hypothetical protein